MTDTPWPWLRIALLRRQMANLHSFAVTSVLDQKFTAYATKHDGPLLLMPPPPDEELQCNELQVQDTRS